MLQTFNTNARQAQVSRIARTLSKNEINYPSNKAFLQNWIWTKNLKTQIFRKFLKKSSMSTWPIWNPSKISRAIRRPFYPIAGPLRHTSTIVTWMRIPCHPNPSSSLIKFVSIKWDLLWRQFPKIKKKFTREHRPAKSKIFNPNPTRNKFLMPETRPEPKKKKLKSQFERLKFLKPHTIFEFLSVTKTIFGMNQIFFKTWNKQVSIFFRKKVCF